MDRRTMLGSFLATCGVSTSDCLGISVLSGGKERVFVLTVKDNLMSQEEAQWTYEYWKKENMPGKLIILGDHCKLEETGDVCKYAEGYEERYIEFCGRTPEEVKELAEWAGYGASQREYERLAKQLLKLKRKLDDLDPSWRSDEELVF